MTVDFVRERQEALAGSIGSAVREFEAETSARVEAIHADRRVETLPDGTRIHRLSVELDVRLRD